MSVKESFNDFRSDEQGDQYKGDLISGQFCSFLFDISKGCIVDSKVYGIRRGGVATSHHLDHFSHLSEAMVRRFRLKEGDSTVDIVELDRFMMFI